MFMLLIILGYVFGIIHKLLYSRNWVIWAYVALLILVCADVVLYCVNRRRERTGQAENQERMK
jgi:cytochrome c-type biogenesis protein CcmH/NrfF